MTDKNYEAVIQNLIDAGCDKREIDCFIKEYESGNVKKEVTMLEAHRKILLDGLHKKQRQIDCLDYLVYKLGKEIQEGN